ncbi:Bardet-Biedl syndrome 10 protein homolog [Orbicella faveolata]|uniref:Bardet-Biedl syndrome 10 protein homolog n=1 Tax=Orbicella faveolata TaxID=48498 RepID=UPI0009E2BF50|nr:Bardet-Biedl syndrome 10 protein homolog [Orbicella faveolata]
MAVALEALKICETLEGILKPSFGPNGLDVLLNSSSGNILITNNGAVILKSLNLDNLIGRTIVDKIISYCCISGDGGTSFLLLLTTVLREVVGLTGIRAKDNGMDFSSHQRQSLVAISRAFHEFESSLLEVVLVPVLDKIAVKTDIELKYFSLIKQRIVRLFVTSLNGKFPISTVSHFAELLCELMTKTWNSSEMSLKDSLLHLIDEFPHICIEVPGLPVLSSQIKAGILIPRGFATEQEGVPTNLDDFMFVVMNCSLDTSEPETSSSIRIRKNVSFDASIQWKRKQVQKAIVMFADQNVRLILSSQSVSDLVLHFCRQYDIAVVSMMPQEYADYICKCAGVLAIDSLDGDNLSELFLVKGISCGLHTVGHHKFVHLQFDSLNCKFIPHSILLCSPAQGLCKQYYLALHHALKCVKMSLSEDEKRLLFLPGAGACELAMSFSLKAFSKSVTDSHLLLVLEILGKALQTIPKMLHQNSFSLSHQKDNFMFCLNEIERSWKQDRKLLGIDAKTGKPVDPFNLEIYEPFQGKFLLLQSLLQYLSQLLRTEKLIGVQKKK